MNKHDLFNQIMWEYHIPAEDIVDVFSGVKEKAGHYNRAGLFRKMIETYSWFTLLTLFSVSEINEMLTHPVINSLRTASLRKKYAFVKKRLQEIIPASE